MPRWKPTWPSDWPARVVVQRRRSLRCHCRAARPHCPKPLQPPPSRPRPARGSRRRNPALVQPLGSQFLQPAIQTLAGLAKLLVRQVAQRQDRKTAPPDADRAGREGTRRTAGPCPAVRLHHACSRTINRRGVFFNALCLNSLMQESETWKPAWRSRCDSSPANRWAFPVCDPNRIVTSGCVPARHVDRRCLCCGVRGGRCPRLTGTKTDARQVSTQPNPLIGARVEASRFNRSTCSALNGLFSICKNGSFMATARRLSFIQITTRRLAIGKTMITKIMMLLMIIWDYSDRS